MEYFENDRVKNEKVEMKCYRDKWNSYITGTVCTRKKTSNLYIYIYIYINEGITFWDGIYMHIMVIYIHVFISFVYIDANNEQQCTYIVRGITWWGNDDMKPDHISSYDWWNSFILLIADKLHFT